MYHEAIQKFFCWSCNFLLETSLCLGISIVVCAVEQCRSTTVSTVVLYSGLRPSVLAQDRSETKILVLVLVSVLNAVVLVLVLQIWCCVVKHGLVTLVVIKILKDTATFQALYNFSILYLEHHYCGDQHWHSLT